MGLIGQEEHPIQTPAETIKEDLFAVEPFDLGKIAAALEDLMREPVQGSVEQSSPEPLPIGQVNLERSGVSPLAIATLEKVDAKINKVQAFRNQLNALSEHIHIKLNQWIPKSKEDREQKRELSQKEIRLKAIMLRASTAIRSLGIERQNVVEGMKKPSNYPKI